MREPTWGILSTPSGKWKSGNPGRMEDNATQHFFLRLQRLDGYLQLVQDFFLSTDYTRALVVPHEGGGKENPHWHIIFSTPTAFKISTIRKRLNKVFTKGKGNGHCSLKEWDGELVGAGSYCFHENTDPVIKNGFTDDEITKMREANQVIQEKMKKEKTHMELVQIIRDKCDKEQCMSPAPLGHEGMVISYRFTNRHQVWRVMIEVLEEYKVKTSIHDLDRWYTTIMRVDNTFAESVYDLYVKRFEKLA